jgi:hypothetical protein
VKMKPENGSKHRSGPVMATLNIRSFNERSKSQLRNIAYVENMCGCQFP